MRMAVRHSDAAVAPAHALLLRPYATYPPSQAASKYSIPLFISSTAKPEAFKLKCPGLSTLAVPDLTRKQLPKGLARAAFRRSTVLGVRITVSGQSVASKNELPHIAGAGLRLVSA